MIEKDFKDRIPTYPGRVELIPVEGKANTYTMKRADEPTEEGTPIDKATFESIVKSRLTGRFYIPELKRNIHINRSNLTSNLLSGTWTLDTSNSNKAYNSIFYAESSSNNANNWTVNNAFNSSGWQSVGGTVSWIKIYHPTPVKVKNIRFGFSTQYSGRFIKLQIQGSNNGETWDICGEFTSVNTNVTEYTLSGPGEYLYYRIYIESSDSNRITITSLSYSLYDIITYTNDFSVAKFPGQFTTEQIALIKTPADVSSFAITQNTLNGVNINTILQSNKRYELIYNGSTFDAKEV